MSPFEETKVEIKVILISQASIKCKTPADVSLAFRSASNLMVTDILHVRSKQGIDGVFLSRYNSLT